LVAECFVRFSWWCSRHADVDGAAAGAEDVELGEFVAGGSEADGESVDFAVPAFLAGFGDSVDEVVVDLDEPGALSRVGS
jgi:hypothetical protein